MGLLSPDEKRWIFVVMSSQVILRSIWEEVHEAGSLSSMVCVRVASGGEARLAVVVAVVLVAGKKARQYTAAPRNCLSSGKEGHHGHCAESHGANKAERKGKTQGCEGLT